MALSLEMSFYNTFLKPSHFMKKYFRVASHEKPFFQVIESQGIFLVSQGNLERTGKSQGI